MSVMKITPGLILDGIRFAPSFRLNRGYTRINYLHLDITSNCNLRCKMCEWRYKVPREDMPWELYKRVIDEGLKLGMRKMVLASRGEGLIHPKAAKMINYAHDKGLGIELVTNLTVMNDELLDAVSNVNRLAVSIDGATKETYEKIRKGANFKRTIDNLRRVAANKRKTRIQINYVLQKDNYQEIDLMVDLMGSIPGVNHLSFGFPNNEMKEVIEQTRLNVDEFEIYKQKAQVAAEKLKKYPMTSNQNIDPDHLEKYGESILQGSCQPYIHEIPCYNLWFGTFINPSGLVFPCCDFYEEAFILGDLKEQSLKEIWRSEKFNDARRRFKGRKPKVCERCPGNNRYYHDLLKGLPFSRFVFGF